MRWAFWRSPEPQAQPQQASHTKTATVGALAVAVAGILAGVYANEGGYVNHPNDPGGATNYGVTENVARRAGYRGPMRYFPKHCTTNNVCADEIYIRNYMKRPGFWPLIPIEPAVADELVDTGANMGPVWPSRWFQQAINEMSGVKVAVDGRVGPNTVIAYRVMQRRHGKVRACVLMLNRLDAKQRARYDDLVRVNPKLKVFYRGWINKRINNVSRSHCGQGWA